VRGGQHEAERIAILDLAIEPRLQPAGVLDLLLHGGDDPQTVVSRPLPQELQEPDILGELLARRLRAQELGQLVDDEDHAFGMARGQLSPPHAAITVGGGHAARVGGDVLQSLARIEVNQRDGDHPRGRRGQLSGLRQPGEIGEQMRFAGTVLTDDEDAAAGRMCQRAAQRLQVPLDLARAAEAVRDPRGVGIASLFEPHDRGMRPHAHELANRLRHASASLPAPRLSLPGWRTRP
jgi:hypothetical protein